MSGRNRPHTTGKNRINLHPIRAYSWKMKRNCSELSVILNVCCIRIAYRECFKKFFSPLIDTARIVCEEGSMTRSRVRPSVHLSVLSIDPSSGSGGFVAERPTDRRYRSIAGPALSSKCGQCHADSRGTKRKTHLLLKCFCQLIYLLIHYDYAFVIAVTTKLVSNQAHQQATWAGFL